MVAEWGILVAVAEDQAEAEEEGQGILVGVVEDHVEEEEEEVAAPILINWLVIGVGAWPFGP